MAQSMITFRMDSELKNKMEKLCDNLGMNLTTAFTIFAKKMTREQKIPFEVSYDPFYSENNIKELESRIAELKSGRYIIKSIEELEAMEDE
jgi:DNA-damage-inducible protein J